MKQQHGTANGYARGGCRCVECREAQRIAIAEWRMKDRLRIRARQVFTEAQLHDALTKPEVFWW